MSFFNDRVVIVTGAGRGIGAASAKLFAKKGAKVVLVSRTQSQLDDVAKEIKAEGGECFSIAFDLKETRKVESIVDQTIEKYGKIDVLVNNAATIHRKPIFDVSIEDWEFSFRVNVKSLFFLTQAVMKKMKKNAGCSVVNLSSLAGIRSVEKFPGFSVYVASKYAVSGLTEAFAAEASELGIRVNAVAPGAVNTKMLSDNAPELKSDANPDDIAKIIVDFADSDRNRVLNGSVLEVFSNLSGD